MTELVRYESFIITVEVARGFDDHRVCILDFTRCPELSFHGTGPSPGMAFDRALGFYLEHVKKPKEDEKDGS
jgi:hypothetical protein